MTGQITPSGEPFGAADAVHAPPLRLTVLGPIDLLGPGGSLRAVLAQPKRFALLVHLALASGRGYVRRDTILGLFWPEHDQTRARTALRQALRFLRVALGEDAFDRRGDDEIAVRPASMSCDVTAFEDAIRAGRVEDALDIYRGDFLAGFFVGGGGAELDQWLDDERARLRQLAMKAAGTLAARAEKVGDMENAARWARRAVAIVPHDEGVQRTLIRLLDASGDQVGALYAYDVFARRLEREMEAKPARETQALAAAIRGRRGVSGTGSGAASATKPETPSARSGLVGSASLAVAGAGVSAGALSIAVLPFSYTGPEDEGHLGDALGDEIRDALRAVDGLAVASRLESAAFAADRLDPSARADRLHVRMVLSGAVDVTRETLVLSARLTDTADGREIWRDQFVRENVDLFAVQDRLVRAVVGALRISLAAGDAQRLVRRPTADLAAYNLYLRGRYHWRRRPRETRKGLEFFERAIARDPLFALAHAGVADVYNTLGSWEAADLPSWEAFPRAHAAAMKALEIDPALAEAHTPLAYANMHYRWDWNAAGREFRHALALDPSYSHAHHWHSHYLMAQGRVIESLDASQRALELDPLDVIINVHLAWHYWLARENDATVEQSARTAELEPNDPWPAFFAGMAEAARGDAGAAVAQHRLAVARCEGSPVMHAALGYSLAVAGEGHEAERILRALRGAGADKAVSSYEIAVIHGAIGRVDQAFDWLDRAYEERSAWLAYLAVDPRLDDLRRDERFSGLLRAVALDRGLQTSHD